MTKRMWWRRWFERPASPARGTHLWVGALVLAPGMTWAACDPVIFSSSRVDLGTRTLSALPVADVPGYKVVGVRTVTLNAACDDAPDARRLDIDVPAAGDAPDLVRWSTPAAGAADAGAARVLVERAMVGGRPVPMTFTLRGGTTTPATPGPLAIAGAGVLGLDLRGLPGDVEARRTLSMTFRVQALVRSTGFAPTGATPFRLELGVSLP